MTEKINQDGKIIQIVSFQDEFGGYSSRLRHQKSDNKRQKLCDIEELEDTNHNLEVNLC